MEKMPAPPTPKHSPNNLALAWNHSRSRREMKQAGIITLAHGLTSAPNAGLRVGCFIGIILKSAKRLSSALARLERHRMK